MAGSVQIIKLVDVTKAVLKAVTAGQLIKAVHAGGEVIRGNAMVNANSVFSSRATNALANSIVVETGNYAPTEVSVNVGPTVIYGRIQELGGLIRPTTKKFLHFFLPGGQEVFAKKVLIPPRPYLRPAVDEHLPEIQAAVGHQLKKQIEAAS